MIDLTTILGSEINPNAIKERFEGIIDYSVDQANGGINYCGWATGDYELRDCSKWELQMRRRKLLWELDNDKMWEKLKINKKDVQLVIEYLDYLIKQ